MIVVVVIIIILFYCVHHAEWEQQRGATSRLIGSTFLSPNITIGITTLLEGVWLGRCPAGGGALLVCEGASGGLCGRFNNRSSWSTAVLLYQTSSFRHVLSSLTPFCLYLYQTIPPTCSTTVLCNAVLVLVITTQ